MPVTASTNENMEIDHDDNQNQSADENSSNTVASTSTPGTSNDVIKINRKLGGVCKVMASPSIVPSVTVSLHPLVIMNISEHWTRIRAQEGKPQQGIDI